MSRQEGIFKGVTVSDLKSVANEIADKTSAVSVWVFRGEMGSGKTTLIKEVCHVLGVTEVMSSPTFSIVNEYHTDTKDRLYHFDFYRIKNEREAFEIGTEDYFYSGNPCFIEWPEKIPSLIPTTYADVCIEIENNTQRTIAIALHDGKKENGL